MSIYGKNFKNNLEDFKKWYNVECEEFIKQYESSRTDLSNKIVVAVEAIDPLIEYINLPMTILGMFVDEGDSREYKAELIYAGHITFIKGTFKNGTIEYHYKDDECSPQTLSEFYDAEETIQTYWTKNNVYKQIEYYIYSAHDFTYNNRLDFKDRIIMLKGL